MENVGLENVKKDNRIYYKITNNDLMRPFFMSIVSDTDHWMFISSNGGLTAGRKNAEYALFPYYTDDKITETSEFTGSKSIFRVQIGDKIEVWEPFSVRNYSKFKIRRNLYKNRYGNKVLFEEVNVDLNLTFQYEWCSSNLYGFVRKSKLINNSNQSIQIEMVDGIQNIMPFGVPSDLQSSTSNLVDAYKRSELHENTGLGIYALSAIIVDKAEPSEALKANVVWSLGLGKPKYLVSSLQLEDFRSKRPIKQEDDVKGERGAYFVSEELELSAKEEKDWMIVANVNQTQSKIAKLINSIEQDDQLGEKVLENIEKGSSNLISLNASADGMQCTADQLRDTRHFANVLFNNMRGGIFDENYKIEKEDFCKYLENANKKVFNDNKEFLNSLDAEFTLQQLRTLADKSDDNDFTRLTIEYLPLKFSRRHGDPSRPWNKFSINMIDETDGSKILDYEGNWRDIFQNWEALVHSFPDFIEGMIFRFLNASTFDGYNPYRVTKGGFDWETIEPDDPWSYIGYWGDHQIIYLLKFLEFIEKHFPGRLAQYFDKEVFVYANVPYKIKPYSQILENSKDTIEFDESADHLIKEQQNSFGADGALLRDENGKIHHVNLIEKILATVLAKISNFVPEGGIWMNTQRPEWNDANNALVGNGISMVTLYYLRRFLKFFETVLKNTEIEDFKLSSELMDFYKQIRKTFESHAQGLNSEVSDQTRKKILDGLGSSASDYRTHIYNQSFWGKKRTVSVSGLQSFITDTLNYIDKTIDANKRKDELYHAYNLLTINSDTVKISHLSEMLEGQVAVLSSGYLTSKEALSVLDGLKKSALFRHDQYSYILYPNKELPGFFSKNNIPESLIAKSKLLQLLLEKGNHQIIEKDILGKYHFNGNFRNVKDLTKAVSRLQSSTFGELAKSETGVLKDIFESVFNHKEFTGRSGTFFGYEGLRSIYWHMVSKLLLAVQECCLKAINENADEKTVGRLLEHFYEINEGIGVHKSPMLYGAFPTDPYSHTPANKGAQQPGMTGQVKEDILSRFGELGVFVTKGQLHFNPCLLREGEFLQANKVFDYLNVHSEMKKINLEPGSLAFTYCQVPIIYNLSETEQLEIIFNDGHVEKLDNLNLNIDQSKKVFSRTGEVIQINVFITNTNLK
jgi:hypothetical protein